MIITRVAELVGGKEEDDEEVRELKDSKRLLDGIMELGLRRLKDDLLVREERDGGGEGSIVVKEEELAGLRRVIVKNSDVFEVLCENIQRQVGGELEHDDVDDGGSSLAITLRREERAGIVSSEEDEKLMKSIQRRVQMVHLDEMKECLEREDIDATILHIRYLHLDYGVAEAEYR